MADTTLKDFVREALARGESRDAVAAALLKAGWPEDQVKDALASFADIDFPLPVPRPRRYGGAREAFLYIVFFALLGMVAVQTGRLAFAFVDHVFADPLSRVLRSYQLPGLRWAIASLMVGYPIFLYLGWRLGAAYRKDPERRLSRIRVWLTYITLIFAALTLIGDLVAVVYNFLGGEVTARFISKALVVGLISGAILFTYTRDAERTAAGVDVPGRIIAAIASVAVLLLVLWAALRVDTPGAARARALDEQRLADLYAIARGVDCHRTYFGAVPASLEAMEAALSERAARQPVASGCGRDVPDDPLSESPYGYEALEGDRFRLCATFQRGWPDDDAAYTAAPKTNVGLYPNGRSRTLQRPAEPGETCFDLEAVDFEEETEEE